MGYWAKIVPGILRPVHRQCRPGREESLARSFSTDLLRRILRCVRAFHGRLFTVGFIYQYICQPAHVVDAVPGLRIPQSRANYALGTVENTSSILTTSASSGVDPLLANDFRSSSSRTMIVVPVTLSVSLKPETIKTAYWGTAREANDFFSAAMVPRRAAMCAFIMLLATRSVSVTSTVVFFQSTHVLRMSSYWPCSTCSRCHL